MSLTTYTPSTTAQTIAANSEALYNRRVTVFNDSGIAVQVAIGQTATTTAYSVELVDGGSLFLDGSDAKKLVSLIAGSTGTTDGVKVTIT